MAMKEYFTFPNAPDVKPRHQMQFCVIFRIHVEVGSYISAGFIWRKLQPQLIGL